MKRSKSLAVAVLAAVCLAVQPPLADAGIVINGDVDPADAGDWNSSTDAYVGKTADGEVEVNGGSDLDSRAGYIGYEDTATGVVSVDGTGSTWTNRFGLFVGTGGSGTLNISGGATVNNSNGLIGSGSGSTGVVSVDGVGSTWTNGSDLYVGSKGDGTLNISGGAEVSAPGSTDVASKPGSTGLIHFGSGGGTLTTGSLYASPIQLSGTGTINTRGLVGDVELVFASTTDLTQTLVLDSQPDQNVTVHLDMAGGQTDNGVLGAGWKGNGSLTIRDGVTVNGFDGWIGYHFGSTGVVTVDGSGSTWNNANLYIGTYGSGALNITGGGRVVTWSEHGVIGLYAGSTGVVTVDGADSVWTAPDQLGIGQDGSGRLIITGGGTVNGSAGIIGLSAGSTGVVTVDGAGSTWRNSIWLVRVGYEGSGTLNISGGGNVSATGFEVYDESLLAIDVANGSLLSALKIYNSPGAIINDGKVRILAGAGATAGNVYEPIVASAWEGSGIYQAVGGTWDETEHRFTVSDVVPGTSGSMVTIDNCLTQRMLIDDPQTGWSVGASFLAADAASEVHVTATAVSGSALGELESLPGTGDAVYGAWTFDVTGSYTVGDPAYLSFDVGPGFDRADLNLWHYDGSQWSEFVAADLTCNGDYASFTVTGFSGYAVSAVPEPGTLVMLGVGVVSLGLIRRRRKR
ncbi:MAG: PEP-CTERM sorting domain-containing protein [Candidatus Nealsonbacteria bacterium]|nr:PEP-CTERM sorting domain-containing protein [Candidatus Nealsonbacteria bacterium]